LIKRCSKNTDRFPTLLAFHFKDTGKGC
jgi:hypothetical protein